MQIEWKDERYVPPIVNPEEEDHNMITEA